MRNRPVRKAYILMITFVSIGAVLIGFKYILPLFLPFVFGYFLAWLAAPIVTCLKLRFRISRRIGSVVVVTIFLLICIVVVYLILRAALHQVQAFFLNLPVYESRITDSLESIAGTLDRILNLENGTFHTFISDKMEDTFDFIQKRLIPNVTNQAMNIAMVVFDVIWNIIIIFISALLIVKEYDEYKQEFKKSCFYKEIHMVTGVLSNLGVAYLKAQFILMCIIAVICMVGVFLIGNHYAILIGAGIAIFDAFPVLGSAFILIPWAIVQLIDKNFVAAAILVTTYLLCQLTRQILEPKLVGDRIGVKPIYTLISMYVGLKIYGGFGFILGPISLVAIRAIIDAGINRLKGITEVKETEHKA